MGSHQCGSFLRIIKHVVLRLIKHKTCSINQINGKYNLSDILSNISKSFNIKKCLTLLQMMR